MAEVSGLCRIKSSGELAKPGNTCKVSEIDVRVGGASVVPAVLYGSRPLPGRRCVHPAANPRVVTGQRSYTLDYRLSGRIKGCKMSESPKLSHLQQIVKIKARGSLEYVFRVTHAPPPPRQHHFLPGHLIPRPDNTQFKYNAIKYESHPDPT